METGGCPHAAIREDVGANLSALEELTVALSDKNDQNAVLLCESLGDNLAANFSHKLADLTSCVIDVSGSNKVPQKGGPGVAQSDLLFLNKIDLAPAVGADLNVMKRDAMRMHGENAKTAFGLVKEGTGVPEIADYTFNVAQLSSSHDLVTEEAASFSMTVL